MAQITMYYIDDDLSIVKLTDEQILAVGKWWLGEQPKSKRAAYDGYINGFLSTAPNSEQSNRWIRFSGSKMVVEQTVKYIRKARRPMSERSRAFYAAYVNQFNSAITIDDLL